MKEEVREREGGKGRGKGGEITCREERGREGQKRWREETDEENKGREKGRESLHVATKA